MMAKKEEGTGYGRSFVEGSMRTMMASGVLSIPVALYPTGRSSRPSVVPLSILEPKGPNSISRMIMATEFEYKIRLIKLTQLHSAGSPMKLPECLIKNLGSERR